MTRYIVSLCAVLCCVAFSTNGFAQQQQLRKKFKDKIQIIQPKPVLQKGRFELVPRFGVTLNDAVNRNFKVGVNANFHIAEPFYVGGIFEWYDFGTALGGPTSAYEQVQNQTGTVPDAAVVNWYGGLEVGFVPVWGKFSFVDSFIVFYDIAVTAGGLFINNESVSIPTAQGTVGGTISIASRVFLNKWLALNMEIRDVIFLANLQGVEGSFTNVASFGTGISLYLPTSFEYSEKIVDVGEE